MYRAPSPYGQPQPNPPRAYSPQPPPRAYSPQPPQQRAYSPQPPPQPYLPQSQGTAPPAGGQVTPGSVTYTTSTSPDGRILYHPFKAVSASYQTTNGIVSGIQWVPAEATHVLPQGAQPASSDFAVSWNRDYAKDDKLKEWQREEDKRRKREEKDSKRLREQQEYRAADEKVKEYERERRKSFNAPPGFVPFPGTAASSGRPPSPYNQPYGEPTTSPYVPASGVYGRERKYSNSGGYGTLDRQFDEMNINREREVSGSGRPRKHSVGGGDERPGPYSSPYAPQTTSNPYGSPYAAPVAPGYATSGGKYSPNPARPAELSNAPGVGNHTYPGGGYSSPYSTTSPSVQQQTYPRGHVMEGLPILPRSRASSPVPGPPPSASPYNQSYPGQPGTIRSHSPHPPPSPRFGGASPNMHGGMLPDMGQQLLPPEGFSRPVNPNLAFAPFNTLKIQAMEDFLLAPHPPRMPSNLKGHDVFNEDWQRLMNDLKLAWSGRLPVPIDTRSGQVPRRTTLVADLIDLWNTSFFFSRGVEVVLYKGHERRSGPKVGTIDRGLPDDPTSDRSESEEEEEDEDESDLEEYLTRNANAYGRPQDFDPVIIARRRREAREEKRRARKEREAKRKAKAKEREKIYALYITSVPAGGAAHAPVSGMPGGYSHGAPTGYGAGGGHGTRHGIY